MPLPRDGDVSALAKRLSELKRRTTTTRTTTTTTSPPKNAKNASKKSETNIGETFDVEDRRGKDQFASALKSAREKWKDRDGENVRTRTATMSPVHKSTREGREGRERERERAAFAKFGKADAHSSRSWEEKRRGEGFETTKE